MYNIRDNNLIDKLIELTKSRTIANGLYSMASHLFQTTGREQFDVVYENGDWGCKINSITVENNA